MMVWMMKKRDGHTDGRTHGRPDARTRYIWRLYTIGPYGAINLIITISPIVSSVEDPECVVFPWMIDDGLDDDR